MVYKRYVDDIFVLFKSKEHLRLFVNYTNSKYRNIKFTFETEDSNNFSFLDVKITRQNKRFVTSIFRKATFSGVFTNYDSFISDTYKIGLVHSLLFQFFKICSSMENFHIEVELLRSIFKCNNYPVNIIDQCIKKFFDKLYVPKQIVPTVPKKELLVVLPYLGTFSLNLRKRLYKSVSKSLPQCNIKVIFQSKNRLSSFFKFKDSIPSHLRSHLIYKFQCSNCNITYYSETERHLKVRAGEHISMSPLTGKRVNNNKKSSVKDHCLLSGHVCSFEDFTVINYESHKFKRLTKESLLFTKNNALSNKQAKSLKLELF